MKKIIMILLMLIVTITLGVSTSKADYPLTVIEKNASATINKTPGTVVIVTPKNLEITSWIVETGSKSFKFVMPEEALTIRAGYEGEIVTGNRIMVIQTANGSISPETAIVENGGSKTFTITPNTGYEINDVLVDGVSQGTVTSYTFSNVAEEHTIIAIFKEIPVTTTYTVTFNSNGGSGNMSSQTFEEGVAQNLITNTFTKEGYTFAGWSTSETGSVEYMNNASYTATSNITLYAVWTTDSYTITYNLDGGSVSGNPTTYNISSETITLNNPTKEGYTFTGWTGSNGSTPSVTVTIPKGSTGNKSYTANWQINTYIITVTQGANGTITPGTTTVNYGSSQTFNIAPNSGYVLSGLTVDGNAVTVSDTYTFTNITGNHTITATFEIANSAPSTPTVTVSSKTTSSFIVTTSATDADGDNLTYKLYVGDSLKATSSATESGTQVTLEASGLSEYTNYSYYVTATDGTETSTSSTASVRTYCSGTGATCNTSWCRDFRYCTECVNGYVACTGGTLNMDNSGGGGICGICSEWGNYSYLCSKCDARVCNLCYDANKPHHSKRNAPTCNTCNGTGSIACSHGVREDHRYCSHYNNTDLTSHTYCSHGYTEPHD